MRVSVAIKLVIFFGLAITAVVAAALAVPWLWMASQSDELAIQSARTAAMVAVARCGLPTAGDWEDKQQQLAQFSRQTQMLGGRTPRLIQVDPFSKALPAELDEFLRRTIDRMRGTQRINELSLVQKG